MRCRELETGEFATMPADCQRSLQYPKRRYTVTHLLQSFNGYPQNCFSVGWEYHQGWMKWEAGKYIRTEGWGEPNLPPPPQKKAIKVQVFPSICHNYTSDDHERGKPLRTPRLHVASIILLMTNISYCTD